MSLTWWKEKLRELLRLHDSPENIALAFAVGVFITFSPFYGLHTILAVLLFTLFRLNKMAVLLGAALNLPWICPAVYFFCYLVGAKVWDFVPWFHGFQLFTSSEFKYFFTSWEHFKLLLNAQNFLKIFLPTLLGSTIVGAGSSLISYIILKEMIIARRKRRQRKREQQPKNTKFSVEKTAIK